MRNFVNTLRFLTLRFKTVNILLMSIAALLLSLGNTAFATNHDPIKVGVSVSLTGDYKAQGESLLEGLSMWANDVNARGALLGRHVEIIHYDDQSSPEKSAEIYEKLITQDEIDLLVGPYASSLTMAASTVAEKYNFPMVSGTSAATAIWNRGYKNIFQVDVPAPAYMADAIRIAKAAGFTSVGILFQDGAFTNEVAMGAKAAAEEAGLKIVTYKSYPAGTTDFVDFVRQLKVNKAHLILGATYLEDSVAIVKELKRQDYSPRALGFTSGPSVTEFGEQLGPLAEGIIGFTPWIKATREPMAHDFDFRYRSIYGRGADSNGAGGYAAGEEIGRASCRERV